MGRMVRLFVQFVGEGEDGIVVKLEGDGSDQPADGSDHDDVQRTTHSCRSANFS